MNIIFAPDFSNDNPYQKLLSEALESSGNSVKFANLTGIKDFLGICFQEKKTDVVHLHWTNWFYTGPTRYQKWKKLITFLLGIILLRTKGIIIVWTAHNISSHENTSPKADFLINKFLTSFSNIIITHCFAAKKLLIKKYKIRKGNEKIFVIPHANYVGRYQNKIKRETARKYLGIGTEDLAFLFFGQVRPYKGLEECVDAFKNLNKENCKLIIAGKPLDTTTTKALKNKCSETKDIFLYLRKIPDNEIQTFMNACDALILPYKNYLTSGAAILGMSFKKTVVIPDMGCARETLPENSNFIYEPTNIGLENALKKATDSNLKAMGEENYKIISNITWTKTAEKTIKAYKAAMSPNPKS